MSMIKQSSVLGAATLLEKVFAFAIVLVASRVYGSEGVGEFFYYFSLVCIFLPLLQMGFPKLLLQDWYGLDDEGRRSLIGRLLVLKVGLLGLVFVTATIADAFVRLGEGNPLAIGLCVAAIGFESFAGLLRTPDQARKMFVREAWVPGMCRLITLLLLLILAGRITSGYQIAGLYALANFVGVIASLPALRDVAPKLAWPHDAATLLRRGLPFSLTGVFVMISLFIDSVMLGRFSMGEVGFYNAAYRVILVAVALTAGVCHALFPRIVEFRQAGEDERAALLVGGALRVFLILGCAIALGGILIGRDLMTLLYGAEFSSSGLPFCILCLLVPLSAAANITGHALEAGGQQKRVMWINLRSASFNVVANLALIPLIGMVGAAITTVLTEAFTVAQMGWGMRRSKERTLDSSGLWRVLPFALATGVAFALLQPLHMFWQVPLGALAVGVIFVAAHRFWLAGLPQWKEAGA